jgi:hypothetical protein
LSSPIFNAKNFSGAKSPLFYRLFGGVKRRKIDLIFAKPLIAAAYNFVEFMIFAAIGSINGNKNALESALDAIAETGIQTILHTGDAIMGGDGGNEVIALLEKYGVICVQGNKDRMVVRY